MPWSICVALITYFLSNDKTRDMIERDTYLYELTDEVFNKKNG